MGQMCCCIQISQPKVGIKESWGKFDKVLNPGVHFVNWCAGKRVKSMVTLRIQQTDVKCQTKTKDDTFLIIATSIQYRVLPNMVMNAYYRLTDPRQQIKAYILDNLISIVPKMTLAEVFENKDEIAVAAGNRLHKELSPYGVDVMRTLIVQICPDESVRKAIAQGNPGHMEGTLQELLESLNAMEKNKTVATNATLEHIKAKEELEERRVNIKERSAKLLEAQNAVQREQLEVVKESLLTMVEVEKQNTKALTKALSALEVAISGFVRNARSH